jgi:hypothetical protein
MVNRNKSPYDSSSQVENTCGYEGPYNPNSFLTDEFNSVELNDHWLSFNSSIADNSFDFEYDYHMDSPRKHKSAHLAGGIDTQTGPACLQADRAPRTGVCLGMGMRRMLG